MKSISKPVYIFLLVAATIVYIFGLFINVMEIDAAQYASLSHEMLLNKCYTMLHFRYLDYLDKPPFCFWLEVLSYKIFGINNFSYKLPSFIFTILGLFATYNLAKKFYSKKVARLSVLILYTCQGFFLFNHDIRTDTILAGSVIFAIWQIWEYLESKRLVNFMLGFTAIAIAMLTKGPIGLMVPLIAISGQIIYEKRWKDFLRIEWLIGIIFIGCLLLPFLSGLYQQYGSKGLRFYFWTQSFGRITGENPLREHGDYLFFVHSFIWAFLPWAFLSIFAIAYTFKVLIWGSKKFEVIELLTFAGTLIPFVVLSLSKYKIPHYIFVLFPLLAILTASSVFALIHQFKFWKRFLKRLQVIMLVGLWILLYFLLILIFPCKNFDIWTVIITLNLLTIYFLFRGRSDWSEIIISPAITIIAVNFMLNAYLYPHLLNYQAGQSIAKVKIDGAQNIYAFKVQSYSYDFYAKKIVRTSTEFSIKNIINQKKQIYIITDIEGLSFLFKEKAKISDIKIYYDYPITRLTLKFLNPSTRFQTLRKIFMLKIN